MLSMNGLAMASIYNTDRRTDDRLVPINNIFRDEYSSKHLA